MSIIKKTVLLFLSLSIKVTGLYAQSNEKIDSIYYLLDTVKTPVSDRLWTKFAEGRVTSYELKVYSECYPLLLNRPTFAYSTNRQTPIPLANNKFDAIKKISLSDLLLRLKQFAAEDDKIDRNAKKIFFLYFIEPSPTGYTIVKTQLDGSGPKKVTD